MSTASSPLEQIEHEVQLRATRSTIDVDTDDGARASLIPPGQRRAVKVSRISDIIVLLPT